MQKMKTQRILVAMMDGFGLDYFRAGDMPTLERLSREGMFCEVKSMFPSVTNVINRHGRMAGNPRNQR